MDSPPSSPLTSPLTTFFYVLMRDYLPTGTVKMLVERSKLAGDPDYSAPELEQLAARYAGELLQAPPRAVVLDDEEPDHNGTSDSSTSIEEIPPDSDGNGATAAPRKDTRPSRTGRNKVSEATLERVREWMRRQGGRSIKPGELDEALGFSSATRSHALRALREDGFCKTGYVGRQRIVTVTPSAPDPDDSDEGDVPGDSEGDGEVHATAGDDSAAPEAVEGSDGGESGTAAPDPPPRRSRPPRPAEDDVTLMAKLSDFLKEADEPVWGREIEEHLKVGRAARTRLINKLSQRSCVWVVGSGPRTRFAYRGGVEDKVRPSIDDSGDEGLGASDGHFVDKSAERAAVAKAQRQRDDQLVAAKLTPVTEWAKGAGTFTARQVADIFGVGQQVAGRIVNTLMNDEKIVRLEDSHADGAVCYRFNHGEAKSNGSKRPLDGGAEGATLEGRALAAMTDRPMRIGEVAERLGVSHEVAVNIVGKLFREGEVRPRKSSDGIHYAVTI